MWPPFPSGGLLCYKQQGLLGCWKLLSVPSAQGHGCSWRCIAWQWLTEGGVVRRYWEASAEWLSWALPAARHRQEVADAPSQQYHIPNLCEWLTGPRDQLGCPRAQTSVLGSLEIFSWDHLVSTNNHTIFLFPTHCLPMHKGSFCLCSEWRAYNTIHGNIFWMAVGRSLSFRQIHRGRFFKLQDGHPSFSCLNSSEPRIS